MENTNTVSVSIEDLIRIKEQEKKLNPNDYPSFNAYFKASWLISKPLRDWAYNQFDKACKEKGLVTNDDIHSFVLANDRDCSNVDINISGILQDNDKFKVTAWIDYDYDTTLCKFTVIHKPSGFFYKDAIDLGEQYLKHGISIQI